MVTAAQAEEELRRRGVLTSGGSVLEAPKEKTTLDEVKSIVESLFKGSAKGIINVVGGWGNLYDELKKSKDPSAFSSQGIVNTIANLGGPDLMKISGWKGVYKFAEAGAPSAAMGALVPGSSLFSLSTPARTAAAEFGAGGVLGTAAQTVAPESPYAQVAIQSLPYLIKGGAQGLKEKAQQKKIDAYIKLLPEKDQNIFETFILKGQGTSDPVIASDIARLAASPKYAELVAQLNEGASARALAGMQPKESKLTEQQSTTSIIKAIQNKLEGLRESKAEGLFEKAKGYGGGNALVDPTVTLQKIDGLIARYSSQATPNAEKAVQVLQNIRDRLSPSFTTQGSAGTTITRAGTPDVVVPGSAGFTMTETGTPSRTIPGSPSRNVTEQVQVIKYDSLGMPYQTTETRTRAVPGVSATTVEGTQGVTRTMPSYAGTTIAGTPDVTINVPGAQPFTVYRGPKKLTVEETQGLLSEFGKKANQGDQLIKDLSITDEKIISSAIFGGLKDDLLNSYNSATGSDKTALGLLRQARERTQKAADAYREAISQGLPSWLKDKSLSEISPEELFDKYQKLTPAQRTYARQLVADTDQEALAFLDRKVYDNFINQAKRPNLMGEEAVDLGELATAWKKMSDSDKDALMAALGTNKDEFSKRMDDAKVFTQRTRLAKQADQGAFTNEQVRETQAAVGAAGGYGLAKATQLAMDTFNMMTKNGLNEDQLAKILFTPEGKNFLSSARLSPRGTETLNALTALDNVQTPSIYTRLSGQAGRVGARAGQTDQPQLPPEPAMSAPTEETAISPEEALQELQRRGIEVPVE